MLLLQSFSVSFGKLVCMLLMSRSATIPCTEERVSLFWMCHERHNFYQTFSAILEIVQGYLLEACVHTHGKIIHVYICDMLTDNENDDNDLFGNSYLHIYMPSNYNN